MRYLRADFCRPQNLLERIVCPYHRRYAHGGAIAPAVVGLGGIALQPVDKMPTVAAVGIHTAYRSDRGQIVLVDAAVHYGSCDRAGQD